MSNVDQIVLFASGCVYYYTPFVRQMPPSLISIVMFFLLYVMVVFLLMFVVLQSLQDPQVVADVTFSFVTLE